MKQQIFIDNEYQYDYELIDDNVYTLYYSNSEDIAMQIKDDGNDLLLSLYNENKLDYAEAERLFIFLKLINSSAKYEIGTKILL